MLGLHWRVPSSCPGSQDTGRFRNMGTSSCCLLMGFVPLLRASTKNVRTLPGGIPLIRLLWAPGDSSEMGLWGPLLHTCRMGLSTRLVFPQLCVHAAWRTSGGSACSPLGLLQGMLAVSLGRSRGQSRWLPGSPELRFQRLQGGVHRRLPIMGLLLLTPGCGHPRLSRRVHCKPRGWFSQEMSRSH